VIIPLVWGDVNTSLALLKSLRLGLEISLSLDIGFPFTLSSNMEVDLFDDVYGRVEGIPAALQPLLGNGQYERFKNEKTQEDRNTLGAEEILERLRCLGELAISVASIQKSDDCLYDLARTCDRPIELYFVLLRWILREQDEPNLSIIWSRICQPLNTLMESLMPNENSLLTKYLKEAAQIAAEANLKGSSFKRTAQTEPFTAFITAVKNQKPHLDLELMFAALTEQYYIRLDRINREYHVGVKKLEQVKHYYNVLRNLYEEVYSARPEKLLSDQKTLEAAYLFFLEEARKQLKNKSEDDSDETNTTV
jgi:CRISPR-associated protein Csc3